MTWEWTVNEIMRFRTKPDKSNLGRHLPTNLWPYTLDHMQEQNFAVIEGVGWLIDASIMEDESAIFPRECYSQNFISKADKFRSCGVAPKFSDTTLNKRYCVTLQTFPLSVVKFVWPM